MKKYHHRIKMTLLQYWSPNGFEFRTYFVLQSKRFWFNKWEDRSYEYSDIWPVIKIAKDIKDSKTSINDIQVVRCEI